MKRLSSFGLVCIVLVLGACKSTDPTPIDVTGSWSGANTELGWTLTMTLAQSGNAVTGTGSLLGHPLTIRGGVAGATISVGLASPGYFAATYSGTISGNDIAGTVNESGFDNMPLDVSRQVRRGP